MLIVIYIALFPGHVGGEMQSGNEANRDIVFATSVKHNWLWLCLLCISVLCWTAWCCASLLTIVILHLHW